MSEFKVIARVRSGFAEKFGVPRQAGLAATRARIVFEPEYRVSDALRGLDGFSHIWVLWQFSQAVRENWSPTVRPPRLGGNARLGVFATRSPFRPNNIGLSAVKLLAIERLDGLGDTLLIEGADMLDGTPVFDIKPYLPYADAIADARGGFADGAPERLSVEISPELLEKLPESEREAVLELLALDPRPRYQHDAERVYGFEYAGFEIKFRVDETKLFVGEIERKE